MESKRRAELLFEQHRYPDAIAELRRQLAQEPDDPHTHALLALCLESIGSQEEALRVAANAIRMAPDYPFSFYASAFILARRKRTREAEQQMNAALRLDPYNPEYYNLLGQIRLEQENWAGALAAAEAGLKRQGDHIGCSNVRTRALIKLKRGSEALLQIDSTLSVEPDNAYSHANKGWTLLEARRTAEALEHFREALRLRADLKWARDGMVLALKARYPLYRWVLNYFLWMARLPRRSRYAVVFGLWLLARVIRILTKSVPALELAGNILLGVYLLFCFVTWTADPLFNTLLRFNSYGKYLLTRRQIIASNVVAAATGIALLSLATYLLRQRDGWLILGGGFLLVTYLGAIATKATTRLWTIVFGVVTGLAALAVVVGAIFTGL